MCHRARMGGWMMYPTSSMALALGTLHGRDTWLAYSGQKRREVHHPLLATPNFRSSPREQNRHRTCARSVGSHRVRLKRSRATFGQPLSGVRLSAIVADTPFSTLTPGLSAGSQRRINRKMIHTTHLPPPRVLGDHPLAVAVPSAHDATASTSTALSPVH